MKRWFWEVRRGGWSYKIRGMCHETAGQNFTLRKLGNNQWKVLGYDSNGRQRRYRLVGETVDEAIQEAEEILGWIPEEPTEVLTPDVVFARWLESLSIKPRTFHDYRCYINQFLSWIERRDDIELFKDIRLEHLQGYANDLVRDGHTMNTIRLYMVPVKAASRWAAVNWPGQIHDASRGFKLPKITQTRYESEESPSLSLAEVCDFLEYLESAEGGGKIIVGVALQALAGLRVTEVLRLTRDKLAGDLLTIEGEVKNESSIRRIPLPALALDYLTEHEGERFVAYRQYRAYSEMVTGHMKAWAADCPGVGRRIQVRELRRTLPSELKATGQFGWITERYLGHAAKTITDRHYVALSEGHLIDLMRSQVVRPINRILRSARTTLRAKKHEKSTEGKVLNFEEIRKFN